jgi:indole-3-acetate monooxygenase
VNVAAAYPTDLATSATLDAVRALAPLVRELAPAAERERCLSPRVHRALAEAGVYRMLVPRAAGGDELALPIALRVVETLAAADGSTGWCAAIGSGTNALGAYLDPVAAAATLWADPNSVSAGVFAPVGRALSVDGGYRVSGRWTLASGCANAGWFFGNCVVLDAGEPRLGDGGERTMLMLAVPMSEARIHDTWNVAGLRGTGSHDVEVDDVFVPSDRGFRLGRDPSRVPGPLAAFPLGAFLDVYLAVVATGITRGALDAVTRGMAARASAAGGDVASLPTTVAFELAELEATARAARAALFASIDPLWQRLAAGESATPEDGNAVALASKHAVRAGADVVSRAFRLGGVRALFDDHPLQRALRDVHAVTLHVQFALEHTAAAGRQLVAAGVAASTVVDGRRSAAQA